jgi:hypothetical protein
MPLQFTGANLRFLDGLRHVVVAAERNGIPFGVLIPAFVIEHLSKGEILSKDASLAVVAQNKAHLQEAGERAFLRQAIYSTTVTITIQDIGPDATMSASKDVGQPGQSREA